MERNELSRKSWAGRLHGGYLVLCSPVRRLRALFVLVVVLCCCLPAGALAQGIYIPVAGPVNRSMGGATTAVPLDGIGAMYWNPATISGLPASELGFGADLLFARINLSSSSGPSSGSTRGEPGGVLIPNVGWIHRGLNSKLTFGLGIHSVAGFKTNYPSSFTNPILTPQPNGVGRLYSEAQFAQISPAASFQVTDRLSVAVGPMVTLGALVADPLLFVAPNPNGYPTGRGTQVKFGAGVQGGLFYRSRGDWDFGASLKSPQWLPKFQYTTEDAAGGPRYGQVGVDLPMILSLGAAYRGFEHIIWSLDYRYFDFSHAAGLGDTGFTDEGALRGLGWRSVNALITGFQYRIDDKKVIRGGYGINQSPIVPATAGLNIASPLVQEQVMHIGGSLALTRQATLNMAYSYFPTNEISGPIQTFLKGALPGSSVTNRLSVHTLSFGVTVTY
jgi:long-chain fatty acid transport protein